MYLHLSDAEALLDACFGFCPQQLARGDNRLSGTLRSVDILKVIGALGSDRPGVSHRVSSNGNTILHTAAQSVSVL